MSTEDSTQPPPRKVRKVNANFVRHRGMGPAQKPEEAPTNYPRPDWMADPKLLPKKPPNGKP